MKDIAIFVLAAGSSSRMNAIKQLLPMNNKALINIAIDNAEKTSAKKVFGIIGANASKIKKEITSKTVDIVFNQNHTAGLSTSIISGLEHIQKNQFHFDGILMMLVDQPQVTIRMLNSLINTFNKNSSKIIGTSYLGKAGVPAIFPKQYFKELAMLTGDVGAKKCMQNNVANTILLETNEPLIDLDTQKEYQTFIKKQ